MSIKTASRSLALLMLLTVALAMAGAERVQAQPQLQSSKYFSGSIIAYAGSEQVVIEGGFIYWVANERIVGKSGVGIKSTLMQRSMTTGLTRELFSTNRGAISDIGVGAGRIAFMSSTLFGYKHPRKWTATLLAMSSVDAAPTVLTSGTMHFRQKTVKSKRKGKKRTRRILTSCGTSVDLRSVSESGQILVSETTDACAPGREFSIKQSIYAADSVIATPVGLSDDQFASSLSNDLLVYTGESPHSQRTF